MGLALSNLRSSALEVKTTIRALKCRLWRWLEGLDNREDNLKRPGSFPESLEEIKEWRETILSIILHVFTNVGWGI